MISFSHRITFAVCASLLCLFGVVSWTAVLTKNAILACAFYCLDPNFLVHAPIIKSDVAFSLGIAPAG